MPDKPSKPQEQPKPENRPVPPRQNDPLLEEHVQEGFTPTKETRSK